jgi:hypothetical protein
MEKTKLISIVAIIVRKFSNSAVFMWERHVTTVKIHPIVLETEVFV